MNAICGNISPFGFFSRNIFFFVYLCSDYGTKMFLNFFFVTFIPVDWNCSETSLKAFPLTTFHDFSWFGWYPDNDPKLLTLSYYVFNEFILPAPHKPSANAIYFIGSADKACISEVTPIAYIPIEVWSPLVVPSFEWIHPPPTVNKRAPRRQQFCTYIVMFGQKDWCWAEF